MVIWRILLVVFGLLFLLMMFFIIRKKYLKTEYNFAYVRDKVVSMNKISKSTADFVFVPNNDSHTFISEYIVSKKRKKKSFICEYCQKMEFIKYYVIAFGPRTKILQIIDIKDKKPKKYSKLIKLPRKTRAVNIVVNKVNQEYLSYPYFKPISKKNIILYSLFTTIALFSLLFVIRGVVIEIFGTFGQLEYANNMMILDLSLMIGTSLFVFIILLLTLFIKKRKYNNKGDSAV